MTNSSTGRSPGSTRTGQRPRRRSLRSSAQRASRWALIRVWIASPPTASVVVLDPRSGQVLQRIGVGDEPSAIAGARTLSGWRIAQTARCRGSIRGPGRSTARFRSDANLRPSRRGGARSGSRTEATQRSCVSNSSSGVIRPEDRPASESTEQRCPRSGRCVRGGPVEGVEHRGGEERVLVGGPVGSIDPTSIGDYAGQILSMTNDGLVGFRRVAGEAGDSWYRDALSRCRHRPPMGRRTRSRCGQASTTRTGDSCSRATSSGRSSEHSRLTPPTGTSASSSAPTAVARAPASSTQASSSTKRHAPSRSSSPPPIPISSQTSRSPERSPSRPGHRPTASGAIRCRPPGRIGSRHSIRKQSSCDSSATRGSRSGRKTRSPRDSPARSPSPGHGSIRLHDWRR